MFETLILRQEGAVLTISLNRPTVYNAFNQLMRRELLKALQQAEAEPQVRVVVLTGEGKAFSSGQDLQEVKNQSPDIYRQVLNDGYIPLIRQVRQMSKPVLCRLNGVAAGAGCSLALACDVIIAGEEASLIQVFVNIALVPDSGSSFFLPRLVGLQRAFELAATGRKVSAREAQQLGLVNEVVPQDQLDEAVQRHVSYYAQAPTKALGLIKRMLNRSFQSDLESMMHYETWCQEIASRTSDHQEGVQAFLEKRRPHFQGQ
ncbi:MAG: enoyl-CoA hydratase-related protein [Chitinophagales bacterium]|nr:enoyl-CoA hydratase-related protein [Chitinophagales bacterium]MDW8427251.1 enoyl-CoA hydratase-related protein [Chitinophagales bacterium]